MEKIPCICAMRELCMALAQLEENLIEKHGVSLNEAMALCSIGNETVTAGLVASRCGLKPPHASKVIATIEKRGLVMRQLGCNDKRTMCFTLTEEGKARLARLKEKGVNVPETLVPFFKQHT